MTMRIRDHEGLQAAVLRAVLASGGFLVLASVLATSTASAWLVGAGALALGVATVPPRNKRSLALAVALALMAGGAVFLGGTWWLAIAALTAGASYARDCQDGRRALIATLAGTAAVTIGGLVAWRLISVDALDFLPGRLEFLVDGACFGLFAGLGVLGREVELVEEDATHDSPAITAAAPPAPSVAPAAADAIPTAIVPVSAATGELRELVTRATQAFADARTALPESSEVAAAASDLMSKIDRFARRWVDLEGELSRADRAALAERLASVSAREAATEDSVVRAEYASARAALVKQVEYLDGIQRGRERAIARLHHQTAVLERLRFAALHHSAIAAGRTGEELAPLVEELVAAGRDLDCEAEAIAELPAMDVIN